MVSKFIVSEAKLFRRAGGSFFKKLIQWGNRQETADWNAKMLPPQLLSLAVPRRNNGEERYTHRITASDNSCVRGGQHGYEATGHTRQKPNLLICTCEIGDLEITFLV